MGPPARSLPLGGSGEGRGMRGAVAARTWRESPGRAGGTKTRYALTPHEFRCSLDREIAVPQFIRFRIFSVPKLKRLMYTGRANVLISEEKAAPGPGLAGIGLGCPPLGRLRAAFPSSGRSRLSERVSGPGPGPVRDIGCSRASSAAAGEFDCCRLRRPVTFDPGPGPTARSRLG